MEPRRLALHETLELHELLNFKAVCITKSQTMQRLVTDEDIKALMQKDVEQSRKAIDEMQSILASAKSH